VVQWPEAAEVVGDNRAVLGPGEGQHVGVGQGLAAGVSGDGFGAVAAVAQFAGDRGAEHLIQQEPHRRTAACPAR
jgi:hypothetical protein